MKFSDSSGGMLLYVIITAMITSFTCATIVMVALNHSKTAEMGKMRIEAYQLVRAGFEYAYDLLSSGSITTIPTTLYLPDNSNVEITIDNDTSGISNYRIDVSMEY